MGEMIFYVSFPTELSLRVEAYCKRNDVSLAPNMNYQTTGFNIQYKTKALTT